MPGQSGSKCGPGYKSPQDAILNAPRETLMYCQCIVPPDQRHRRHDYVATVDIDPKSPTFCQVISRWVAPYRGDELHHSGWNVCSSCHEDCNKSRNRLVLPCFNSDRIYILDTGNNPRKPELFRVIEPVEVHKKTGLGAPHTSHCLGTGQVMISCIADANGNGGKSGFILLDGQDFDIVGTWENGPSPKFGYDFWYQPRHNVMVSSGFGAPSVWRKGFVPDHVDQGLYSSSMHVWDWTTRKLLQSIDMGKDGLIPLEIRFLHNPDATEGFVGAALGSCVFRFFQKPDKTWATEKVIDIPAKTVEGWSDKEIPSLVTFIILSLDDRYLYISNWFHGDIRQYDITDTRHPKLVGQLFIGGQMCRDKKKVKVIKDPEGHVQEHTEPLFVKGKRVEGGPQMLQLSLDGTRLYVCNSLISVWDQQFYPDLPRNGSVMLQIDVDTEKGGLKLNREFLVDFGAEPDGPVLTHEIRYDGGDCTSDIWL